MEFGVLAAMLVSSSVVLFSHFSNSFTDGEWNDTVVARAGAATTLACSDHTSRGPVAINWMVKSPGTDEWKLILSASERKEFSGGTPKESMRLTDTNFQETGVFSLYFLPKVEDRGLYLCLIKQQERKLREKIILLAVLTVSTVPAAPVPQYSTLRLIANVEPDAAVAKITWAAPGGIPMISERIRQTGTVAKLPQAQISDSGAYACMAHPRGHSSTSLFAFNVDVTVDVDKVASFTNISHGQEIRTAVVASRGSFPLTCPVLRGDYVRLHWQPADTRRQSLKLVYEYDRWRGSTVLTEPSQKLRLAGPPFNAQAGSFSFLLTPGVRDGGLYICEVYLNDNVFSQRVLLSVMKVKASRTPSHLELQCQYSERSQVQRAVWEHQNRSRRLRLFSHSPGVVITEVPLPLTADAAGNYTCTLQLKNGQTVSATHAVTLPPGESVPRPSLLPSLSALLLLVPLVAAAVGVLLWRQKRISDRSIEQSLSMHSGETENIYENPEDVRQVPPQGSVYMDLKPRGEGDVYKELERYEQCQS